MSKIKLFRLIPCLLILLLAVQSSSLSAAKPKKMKESLEQGIKYIKLGNTYREAKEPDKALKYLELGERIIKKANSKYWLASTYEYYGYLFRDMGAAQEAVNYFDMAVNTFKYVIKQKDGSNTAVASIKVDLLNKEIDKIKDGGNLKNNDGKLLTYKNDKKGNRIPVVKQYKVFIDLKQAMKEPENVYILDLSNKDLTSFPSQIKDMTNLQRLNLSNNDIKNVPEDVFASLPNLVDLNLERNNDMSKLPLDLLELKNLKYLNLRRTAVSKQELVDLSKILLNTVIFTDKPED